VPKVGEWHFRPLASQLVDVFLTEVELKPFVQLQLWWGMTRDWQSYIR
jgi:hypothetical protein